MKFNQRADFLRFTGLFLLGLLLFTVVVAHFLKVPLMSRIHWSLSDFLIGVAGAFGMFLVFGWISSLREQAGSALGNSLASCRWYDLAILAILVGVVEELLFRGLLEQSLDFLGPWTALIITNVVFGLLHAVSPLYAVMAAVLGGVLSLLTWGVGDFNLLRPITAHALYDFIGFLVIAGDYRKALSPPPSQL